MDWQQGSEAPYGALKLISVTKQARQGTQPKHSGYHMWSEIMRFSVIQFEIALEGTPPLPQPEEV